MEKHKTNSKIALSLIETYIKKFYPDLIVLKNKLKNIDGDLEKAVSILVEQGGFAKDHVEAYNLVNFLEFNGIVVGEEHQRNVSNLWGWYKKVLSESIKHALSKQKCIYIAVETFGLEENDYKGRIKFYEKEPKDLTSNWKVYKFEPTVNETINKIVLKSRSSKKSWVVKTSLSHRSFKQLSDIVSKADNSSVKTLFKVISRLMGNLNYSETEIVEF